MAYASQETAAPLAISTSFGFSTTAAEVLQAVDLVGKRAIVTGASSGIGIETARALAAAGAAVNLHSDFIPYDPLLVYGQSKSACVLAAVEAERRWSHQGIHANAVNPGRICRDTQADCERHLRCARA